MQDHLTADVFERLVERRCHVSLAYGWLLHLLGCQTYRNQLVQKFPEQGESFLREIFRTQQPVAMPELGEPETVDRILAHLKTDGISSFLETRPLPDYLDTLPDQPEVRQAWAVRNSRRLRDPGVVEHLLSECQPLWHEDAERAVRLTRLAVRIVGHLTPDEVHPRILNDLRFESWSKLGNGLRILGRYRAALNALARARESWDQCVNAPRLKADHLRREARMLQSLGRPDLAFEFAQRSEILDRSPDALSSLTTVIIITNSLESLGRHCEARQHLEKLLESISVEEVGPLGLVAVLNNLAGSLFRQGLSLPAWPLLRERDRFAQKVGKLVRVRMKWMDGRFFEGCGELSAAHDVYREILDVSEEHSLKADQAFVLVDLVRVSVRRRLQKRAHDFAGEAIHRLTRIGLDRVVPDVEDMAGGGPLLTLG